MKLEKKFSKQASIIKAQVIYYRFFGLNAWDLIPSWIQGGWGEH